MGVRFALERGKSLWINEASEFASNEMVILCQFDLLFWKKVFILGGGTNYLNEQVELMLS